MLQQVQIGGRQSLFFGGCQFTNLEDANSHSEGYPVYILEVETVLEVMPRKGETPKKRGALGSRDFGVHPKITRTLSSLGFVKEFQRFLG